VVGQNKAKKAVAVALRNRWRRQALKGEMKNEVLPKNILMIGQQVLEKLKFQEDFQNLRKLHLLKLKLQDLQKLDMLEEM